MSDSYSTSHCFLSFFPAVTYKHNFFLLFQLTTSFKRQNAKTDHQVVFKKLTSCYLVISLLYLYISADCMIFSLSGNVCLSLGAPLYYLNVLNAVSIITIIPSKSNFTLSSSIVRCALQTWNFIDIYLSWLGKGLRPCNREWSFCVILLCALPMQQPSLNLMKRFLLDNVCSRHSPYVCTAYEKGQLQTISQRDYPNHYQYVGMLMLVFRLKHCCT